MEPDGDAAVEYHDIDYRTQRLSRVLVQRRPHMLYATAAAAGRHSAARFDAPGPSRAMIGSYFANPLRAVLRGIDQQRGVQRRAGELAITVPASFQGELIGTMLDITIRNGTAARIDGRRDAALVQSGGEDRRTVIEQAVETVCGCDMTPFFEPTCVTVPRSISTATSA